MGGLLLSSPYAETHDPLVLIEGEAWRQFDLATDREENTRGARLSSLPHSMWTPEAEAERPSLTKAQVVDLLGQSVEVRECVE